MGTLWRRSFQITCSAALLLVLGGTAWAGDIVRPRRAERGYVIVVAATAEVREGPGPSYAVIDTVERDDVFPKLGRTGRWYYVQIDEDVFGWVSGRALSRYWGEDQPYEGGDRRYDDYYYRDNWYYRYPPPPFFYWEWYYDYPGPRHYRYYDRGRDRYWDRDRDRDRDRDGDRAPQRGPDRGPDRGRQREPERNPRDARPGGTVDAPPGSSAPTPGILPPRR